MRSYTGMNAISGDMRGLRRASMAGHVTLEDSDGHRWPPQAKRRGVDGRRCAAEGLFRAAGAEGGGAAKLSANWKADVSLAAQVRGAPLFSR